MTNPIELSLFTHRIRAICDEMGAILKRAAFSPNIKDRLDFSCAVFDSDGQLCAQAAHIPVHLGSMAYAMQSIVQATDWHAGDVIVLNDPFQGGTHLPDVTLIAPVFIQDQCLGFIANRAHHADIGAESPGSMPVSTCLQEEGLIIPPTKLVNAGLLDSDLLQHITQQTRNPQQGQGDFSAQLSSAQCGVQRLIELINKLGIDAYQTGLQDLNNYAEKMAMTAIQNIPNGVYQFHDVMDSDGLGQTNINIQVCLTISNHQLHADFTGTANQVSGNINCPLSVAAAAVYYVLRCLMPSHTPDCAGSFRVIRITAPSGCLVNAQYPAAVTAGNVETSSRIVDVMLGALAQAIPTQIPAASQGTMNNLAMGNHDIQPAWDYYETIAGGMGASHTQHGLHAVQTHMTNTLNTPIEVLESHYPLRIKRYAIRRGSGGSGDHYGGDGLIREFEFLQPCQVTLLTERRQHQPWGANGGHPGQSGENYLDQQPLPDKVTLSVQQGQCLTIKTPGGGGYNIVKK